MRTFTFAGVRFMSERSWNATVDDAARERSRRCEVEEQLAKTLADGYEFSSQVEVAATEGRKHSDQIRLAIQTVLGCNEALKTLNVHLAHRVEQAEHTAALLREQLVKVLRSS